MTIDTENIFDQGAGKSCSYILHVKDLIYVVTVDLLFVMVLETVDLFIYFYTVYIHI